ncbi:Pre-mRNA-processing protein 46 [Intoshia linei]|uniref:Pleiotropic regulator 1 n=1 Tax=Intoshia linei TaxID=1819745 RepID=A0A177B0L2_9BILA|nr:Pre-mRNA-processing protein 46 [Intoshia linei]
MDVPKHSLHTLVYRSLKRTHDLFAYDHNKIFQEDIKSFNLLQNSKIRSEYGESALVKKSTFGVRGKKVYTFIQITMVTYYRLYQNYTNRNFGGGEQYCILYFKKSLFYRSKELVLKDQTETTHKKMNAANAMILTKIGDKQALVPRRAPVMPKPTWHSPWKLYRVISGHLGWVRSVAVEPGNEWFATGAGDRLIKIWDMATGKLKLSLTGHINAVRGIEISSRHPYMFSVGEDKMVKCWDLECNKVIRHYHGHLSGVYCIALHPYLDVMVTGARDATARVWDIRTKAPIYTLTGHTNTIAAVRCQSTEPQIITASHDSTIRLWDISSGKSMCTLTNHKKSVRDIVLHPTYKMMASASPDNIKLWTFPEGNFIHNMNGHNVIINALAINQDNVFVSGGDNGSLYLWDWKSGYNFQRYQSTAQPGSIDSETGIFAMTFDKSGERLITCDADKTIKMYKPDEEATQETDPILWKPEILRSKVY